MAGFTFTIKQDPYNKLNQEMKKKTTKKEYEELLGDVEAKKDEVDKYLKKKLEELEGDIEAILGEF